MFCRKCGCELSDNAKFCGSCGTVVDIDTEQSSDIVAAESEQVENHSSIVSEKKIDKETEPEGTTKVAKLGFLSKVPKKLLPVIGIAAVVILVLVLLFTGVFSSDSARLGRAVTKSLKAYADVVNDLKLPDVATIAERGKYNQELCMWIEEGPYYVVDGVGARIRFAYNQPAEEATLVVNSFFEEADLISAQMQIKGSKVYLGCPELLEDTYVMLDTMTLGQDLADKDVDDVENLSFNFFTLIKRIQEAGTITKEQEKALRAAGNTLLKEIEVEKDGNKQIKINGEKLECTLYNVVIPQDATEDYLEAVIRTIKNMEQAEAIIEVLKEAGLPMDGMDFDQDENPALELLDELLDLIDELGDIELEVAVNKGYVVSLTCEYTLGSFDYDLKVHLGGGDNYVDDFYLEHLNSRTKHGFAISSSGKHAMQKGVFTDKTTYTAIYKGDEKESFVSKLRWEPAVKEDNFKWSLSVGGEKMELEGTVTCSTNSINVLFTDIEVDSVTLGVSYTLGNYKAITIERGETLVFSEMDEDDLEDLGDKIAENGEEWAEVMQEDYYEVMESLAEIFDYWR